MGRRMAAEESQSPTIDLNCDLGESFGVWRLGHDEEMMKHISSANIACGFHAGDPGIMRRTVRLARDAGVSVGAHPGFPDLAGFGRRAMSLSLSEIVDSLVYQIGALQAIARAEGVRVTHVKPHGALYNLAERDSKVAAAVVEAVRQASIPGQELALVASSTSAMAGAAAVAGVRLVSEVFADRAYDADGKLVPRARPGAVLTDPWVIANRITSMVYRGEVDTISGGRLQVKVETACLHGDTPGAPALAATIVRALKEAGVTVAPFA